MYSGYKRATESRQEHKFISLNIFVQHQSPTQQIYTMLASVATAVLAAYSVAARTECQSRLWKVGQRVNTTSGPVDGHAAPKAPEVSEYLGIPYAQPPVGKLRFEPPARYSPQGIVQGKEFVSRKIPTRWYTSRW